jgi:hypothetical protein
VSLNHTQQLSISKIVKWEILSMGNVASVISKLGFVLWVLIGETTNMSIFIISQGKWVKM